MSSEQQPMLSGPGGAAPSPSAWVTGNNCNSGCCALFYLLLSILLLPILAVIYLCCLDSFQLWALQRPNNCIVQILLPPLVVVQSLGVGRTSSFFAIFQKWGSNFCASGEVWLGEFKYVSEALMNPQGRYTWLGEHPLQPGNLPDAKNSRCVFLLALSDRGAGGDGSHEAFRNCIVEATMENPGVYARRKDATAKKIVDDLVQAYKDLPHGNFEAFFTDPARGVPNFWIKYLHYVMFGIDPNNEAAQKPLTDWYLGQMNLMHYLFPFGYIFNKQKLIDAVADVYEQSPAFKDFQVLAKHMNMTKREACALMVSIMRIAGVQGATQTLNVVMGGWKLPDYSNGGKPGVDQTKHWDQLDLSNVGEIHKYIAETCRLDAPVSVSHRIALEPFTCDIAGKSYTFPKGTKIAIPIGLGSTDKKFWGEDAYHMNINRPNLMENWLSFNSVGGRNGGRECPGKEIVMEVLTELLQKAGKVRRGQ